VSTRSASTNEKKERTLPHLSERGWRRRQVSVVLASSIGIWRWRWRLCQALVLASSVGVGVGSWHWRWRPALALASGVGVGVQRWHWRLPPRYHWCCVGVGDVAVPRQCHVVVVDVDGGRLAFVTWRWLLWSLTPSSVSTTISPHEQWLVGWVVVLCRGGSSVGWRLDDYVAKRKML
jgi:hypothetical protein